MKILFKEALRNIRKSIGEFFSIIFMIAIAVLIFIGLKAAGESMDILGWDLLRDTKASDIVIESDFSLEEEDFETISRLNGISKMEEYFLLDVEDEDQRGLVLESATEEMNLPLVESGRRVEKPGEIFLESVYEEDYKLGDSFKVSEVKGLFSSGEDLEEREYTVVGFGNSIDYIMTFDRGNTKVGGGEIHGFGLIHPEDFKLEDSSGVRINLEATKGLDIRSEEYDKITRSFYNEVEDSFKNRPEIRLVSMKDDLREKLGEGRDEIEKARKDLADAEEKIADGKVEIFDGKEELEKNRRTFHEEIEKNKRDLASGRKKLEDGEKQLSSGFAKFYEEEKAFRKGQEDYFIGLKTLNQEKEKLEAGKKEFQEGKTEFLKQEQQFLEGKKELEANKKLLEEGRKELQKADEELEKGQEELIAIKEPLNQEQQKLDEVRRELEKAREEILQGEEEIRQYDEGVSRLKAGISQLEAGILEIDNNISQAPTKSEKETGLSILSSAIEGKEAERSQLEGVLNGLKAQLEQDPENEELKTEIDQVEGQIVGISQGIEEDRAKFNELNNAPTKEELQFKKEGLESEKSGLEQELNTLQSVEGPKVEAARKLIEEKKSELQKWEEELAAGQKELDQALEIVRKSEEELRQSSEKLSQEWKNFKEQESQFLAVEKQLNDAKVQIRQGKEELAKTRQLLINGEKELAQGQNELQKAKEKFESGQQELEAARNTLLQNKRELEASKKDLEEGERTLQEEEQKGLDQLSEAEQELQEAEEELKENEEEFLEEKEKAQIEIAENEEDLDDLEDSIEHLEKPTYKINSHDNMPEIASYFDIVNRLPFISNFFPAFFFFIALLVSLTTMTRMVEEDRLQMGILKALGYKNGHIIFKYIFFAVLASSIGVFLGRILGYRIVAPVISKAYLSVVSVEDFTIQRNTWFTIQAAVISIGLAIIVTFLVARRSLKEKPSELLRPKPPKAGSRIFLESIDFIWRRLSFIYKVTFRNLFRYKSRMFMTIVGVAGGVGLLLLGFGIKDSIGQAVNKQFNHIIQYDYMVIYEEGDSERVEEYEEKINEWDVQGRLTGRLENLVLEKEDGLEQEFLGLAFKEDRLNDFVQLQNRKTNEVYTLNDGALITEGLADAQDLKAGDDLVFSTRYGEELEVKVSGVLENYLEHYLYLSQEDYEKVFDKEYIENMDLLKIDSAEGFSKDLLELEGVYSLVNMDKASEIFDNLTGPLDNLVYVIIFFSAILAFVVLYNLNSINISERKQELSTIKVLGFYNKEVTAYVYRETIFLSFIGIFLGFVLGNIMHKIILVKLIPEEILLDPQIYFMSYGLTTALFIAFLMAVMILVHRRLKGIDMLEALHGD